MNRINKGYGIYQKGLVTPLIFESDLMQFEVKSESNDKDVYLVGCLDDTWNCDCHDFKNRNKRESTKQLICKHIHSVLFLIAEFKQKERFMNAIEQLKQSNSKDVVLEALKAMEIENGLIPKLEA